MFAELLIILMFTGVYIVLLYVLFCLFLCVITLSLLWVCFVVGLWVDCACFLGVFVSL